MNIMLNFGEFIVKNMKSFLKIFLSVPALFIAAVSVNAQQFITVDSLDTPSHHFVREDGNRNENGTVNRGSYLTNLWYDNWTFGIAGGIQALYAGGNRGMAPTGDLEITVTKWVTPTFAARLGYQGFNLRERRVEAIVLDHYQLKHEGDYNYFNQKYFHFDLMLSLTNLIDGYKESRLVNVIPYIHGGYLCLAHPDYPYFAPKRADGEFVCDREAVIGPGVLLNFRVSNHLGISLDFRDVFLSARYHDRKKGGFAQIPSVAVGLTYTINKWYWLRERTNVAPLVKGYSEAQTALAAANAANAALAKQNKEANDKLKAYQDDAEAQKIELKKKYDTEFARRLAEAEHIIYFDINSPVLTQPEIVRFDKYVDETLKRDSNHVFYITGSADKGTGNERINTRLSSERAQAAKKYLIKKCHVPESQVVIKATVISDKHADGRFDRCVLLESE